MAEKARKRTLVQILRSRYWREPDAVRVIRAWNESGQTLTEFAEARRVNRGRLERWIRLLDDESAAASSRDGATSAQRENAATAAFLPVRIVPSPPKEPLSMPSSNQVLEVELVGGDRIRLPPGFAAADFSRLLAVLAEVERC